MLRSRHTKLTTFRLLLPLLVYFQRKISITRPLAGQKKHCKNVANHLFSRTVTTSTCWVWGNMSTGWTAVTL